MRKETKSIGFACALGAFIGALLALEFRARFQYGMYLWPIGALIGGSIAYIAIDFREFCSGVARAYRATIAWRPYVPFWKAYGARFLGRLSVTLSITLLIGVFFFWGCIDGGHIKVSGDVLIFFLGYITLATILITVFTPFSLLRPIRRKEIWVGVNGRGHEADSDYEHRLNEEKKEGLEYFLSANPVAAVFILCVLVVDACDSMLCAMIDAYRTTKQFAIKAFINAHSDRRTICFVDSILGATAGFFYGSATIGALTGAVLGMLNYELVSVRWLKLAPVKV